MRNTLLIRADSDAWRWLRLDADGRPLGGIHAGVLQNAASEAAGCRVVLLVPGADCLITTVNIPGRNRQKILKAAPYALEEQVSDEVENLHFALGNAAVDGAWPVAVIDAACMDRLQLALAEAGLEAQFLVPEVLALPQFDDALTVLVTDGLALVRQGETAGFAVDSDNLGIVLASMYADEDEPVPLVRIFHQQDSAEADMTGYRGAVEQETFSGDPLGIFAQGIDSPALNLLQGSYSRSGEWSALLKPWRATAALLLAGLLANGVVSGVDYYRLSQESRALDTQIEQTFKRVMPATKRIVNPRVQMEQEINRYTSSRGGGGFLGLLGRTGSVIKDVDGVEIGGVTFRGGRLDLDIKVSNLQMLDSLKQSLASSSGLDVEIQSATTGKDQRVRSRLRIGGTGT